MAIRTALRVQLPHQNGEIAKVLHTLTREGIRLDLFVGLAGKEDCIIELLPSDPARAIKALRRAGIAAQQIRVALTWLPDLPASLAQACETLEAAGIHINAVHVVGVDPERGQHVLVESPDVERADQLLWALRY